MPGFVVRKLDVQGRETFSYPASRVLARTAAAITLEAIFTRQDRLDLGYTVFERGDRFVEHFYADRWYNVFEIYAAGSGALRGWYCNIARPAQLGQDEVAQVDLALDVWVHPDGTTLLLDEDEFAALSLSPEETAAALAAVDEIRGLASARGGPFAAVGAVGV